MALNIPPRGDAFRRAGAHFANLEVSPQDTPNMTVKTTAGGFWDDNTTYVEHAGGTSPTLTAPSTNAKLTVIALNLSGALVLIDGAEAASPSLPVIPSDRIPLAVVLLNTTDTTIDDSMVFDLRPVLQIGADINNLAVNEVVGLASQLALKADTTALTNGLAGKADLGGTACSLFKLNANHTGAPTADGIFRVERGNQADVELRWNETTEVWEFTNDGTNFEQIGSASAVTASLTALQASVTANASSITILLASVLQNSSVISTLETDAAAASTSISALNTDSAAASVAISALNTSVTAVDAVASNNASRLTSLEGGTGHPADLNAFQNVISGSGSIFWIWPLTQSTSIPTQSAAGTAFTGAAAASAISIAIKHGASAATASVIGSVAVAIAEASGIVDIQVSVIVAPTEWLAASVTEDTAEAIALGFTIKGTTT